MWRKIRYHLIKTYPDYTIVVNKREDGVFTVSVLEKDISVRFLYASNMKKNPDFYNTILNGLVKKINNLLFERSKIISE